MDFEDADWQFIGNPVKGLLGLGPGACVGATMPLTRARYHLTDSGH